MEFRTVRMTTSNTAPSPTCEDFVARFQSGAKVDVLIRALSHSRSPVGPAPTRDRSLGTVPSPGITIPRKER